MRTKFQHPNTAKAWRFVFFLCSLLGLTQAAAAQLVADFSVDRGSGCAPLAVLFNNKTAGASAAARYLWDFGNGNTSTLHSPGATYRNEQTYTVTLTVTDGGQVATRKATITVYKKPVVDFSAGTAKGCSPLPVPFSSSVQPGDGTIAGYTWDFGNGNVVQGADKASLTHTFTFAQKPSVSLTVTNSHGCYTTLEKPQMLDVLPPVKAQFGVDRKSLCQEGETVQFSNNSLGDSLTYLWDLGDGTTSTQKAPRHIYSRKGAYTVKLRVTGKEGCTDEMVQTNFINVANFSNGIQVAQVACTGSPVSFKAIGSPVPDSVRWNFGAGLPASNIESPSVTFPTAGNKAVVLTSYWGSCQAVVTTRVQVEESPALKGFVQEQAVSCRLPYTLQFEDTTAGVTTWKWEVAGQPAQTGKTARFTFPDYGNYPITLTTSSGNGCAATLNRQVAVINPEVKIRVAQSSSRFGTADCIGLKVKFATESNVGLTGYQWEFGDGGTASAASPEHVFTQPGRYNIVLRYTTASGCTDTAMFREVAVYSKPRIDFSGPAEICSSNPVGFSAKSDTAVRKFYWYYGDNSTPDTVTNSNNYIEHRYMREGTYSVTLIANSGGACADTVVKKNFIKVNPPFQYLYSVDPQCSPERNRMTFPLYTRGAEKLVWDYGDGTVDTIQNNVWQKVFRTAHTYKQPGLYIATFSTINGKCVSRDAATVYVPGKQQPQLSASKDFVCFNDSVELSIGGINQLDLGPTRQHWVQYRLKEIQYADGSPFKGTVEVLDSNWTRGFRVRIAGMQRGKTTLRALVVSAISGCVDSSNVIALTVSGPQAGIQVANPNSCFVTPVVFRDASSGNISSWQWNLGDTLLPLSNQPLEVVRRYAKPGVYAISLKVTDTDGCSDATTINGGLRVLGVKAGFQLPDTVVAINTSVQFTNTSVTINGADVRYTWTYSNGSRISNALHLQHSYPTIGWDTIRLVARTTEGSCADTVVQHIHHDNIHAKFSYTATYINNNACPPMLVKFKNLSRNSRATLWTFGDGSSARNQNTPERTYRVGGTYKVTLYTFGPNNTVDSAIEYITVKGPSATVKADKYFGCLNQQVKLTAQVTYAKNYYWDYGDGTLLRTTDTFSVHDYHTAGIYQPSLVLSDSTGCSVAAELPQPVVIDSLSLAIGGIPPLICDQATVGFKPRVVSVAVEKMNQELAYSWRFGTASSTQAAPVRLFKGEGRYPVEVTATSPYGCVQTVSDTVVVTRSVKGTISGKPEVCAGQEARFTASIPDAKATWTWVVPGGSKGSALQSPAISLPDSGFYPVQLVVMHEGCADTATRKLWVHPNPVVRFANHKEHVCLGKNVTLQASGGVAYQWRSTEKILTGSSSDKPVVAPMQTARYQVEVTSFFGCKSSDSMQVSVTHPMKLAALPDTFVCRGSAIELEASGTYSYRWSGPAGTLRNEDGRTATVRPTAASRYMVIGTDSARCFYDTAYARVRIEELPAVQAGPDRVVFTGADVSLEAKASGDVVRYEWLPKSEVQCSNCAQTTAAPRRDMSYTIAVTNNYGCIGMDTVNIRLSCAESRIYIPNAFTPDKDGLNETFSIRGRGATIKSILIFDRWGAQVFKTTNIQPEEARGAWDGTVEGRKAPSGTYVYVAELICDSGEPFIKKGTVTLIR